MIPNTKTRLLLSAVCLLGLFTLGARGGCMKRANVGHSSDSGGNSNDAIRTDTHRSPDTSPSQDPDGDAVTNDSGPPHDTSLADTGGTDNDTADGSDTDTGTVQCPSTPRPGSSKSCVWKWTKRYDDHDRSPDFDTVSRRTFDSKGRVVKETEDTGYKQKYEHIQWHGSQMRDVAPGVTDCSVHQAHHAGNQSRR